MQDIKIENPAITIRSQKCIKTKINKQTDEREPAYAGKW